MNLPNLDNATAVQDLIVLEYNIALFYMRYIAFGFVFSGDMDQLTNLMCEIDSMRHNWGLLHRN